MDCIFCKIIAGEIPSKKFYEDENMIIIADIEPKAQKHYLCIPKKHFKLLEEMDAAAEKQLLACMRKIAELKDELGLSGGYRLIVNQGDDAGQSVFHLHIHVLGGQKLAWDPA